MCNNDNNAEDTSNDVSEIGTISDLTTPEAPIVATPNDLTSFTSVTPPPTATVPSAAAVVATAAAAEATPTAAAAAPTVTATTVPSSSIPLSLHTKSSTFDYLYEFSETRKVLEEFFKCPSNDEQPIMENGSDVDSIVSHPGRGKGEMGDGNSCK